MPTRRALALASLVLFTLGFARPAAAEQTPKDFVSAIYQTYVGNDSDGMRLDLPQTRRLFTPALWRLIDADAKQAAKRGEVGALNGDPFVDAQDWEIKSFTVDVQETAPDKVSAKVSFRNGDTDTSVTLALVKLKDGWRIDDIVWSHGTLRKLFVKK